MKLDRFPETLAVVRLPVGTEVPDWAESSSIFSVTVTATETSLVCAARSVPAKAVHHKPFTAFAARAEVGSESSGARTRLLVDLLAPLAEAEINAFTVATYGTDWVLVPVADADRAAEAWRGRGHEADAAVPRKATRQTAKQGFAEPSVPSPRKGRKK